MVTKECGICGKKFISTYNRKYCGLVCSREADRQRTIKGNSNTEYYKQWKRDTEKERRAKKKAEAEERKKKLGQLKDVENQARSLGMSYGKYVLMLEQEKKR